MLAIGCAALTKLMQELASDRPQYKQKPRAFTYIIATTLGGETPPLRRDFQFHAGLRIIFQVAAVMLARDR